MSLIQDGRTPPLWQSATSPLCLPVHKEPRIKQLFYESAVFWNVDRATTEQDWKGTTCTEMCSLHKRSLHLSILISHTFGSSKILSLLRLLSLTRLYSYPTLYRCNGHC
jgi:hypothetical protein